MLSAASLLVLSVFLLASWNASAINQSMNLVLLADSQQLQVGSWVSLTLHVFSYGFHADASTINVYLNKGLSSERALSTTRTGTGAFQ